MGEKEENEQKIALEKAIKGAELTLSKATALKHYAVANIINTPDYGNLGKGFYEQTAINVPDATSYARLFAPVLLGQEGKGVGLNGDYLKEKSQQILTESLSVLPIKDALKHAGMKKELSEQFEGAHVFQLSKEASSEIIKAYLYNLADKTTAEEIIPSRIKQRVGGLEEIFAKKEEVA